MENPKNTKDIQDFELGRTEAEASKQPQINKYQNQTESAKPVEQPQKVVPKEKPSGLGGDPVARKKALLGCLGAFGSVMLIFLVLSFVFLASDSKSNPISKLLGVDNASFINGLITFIHVIFILVSLVAFVLTLVGLFKAGMAKKGDKIAKREGIKFSLISGIALMVIVVIWGFVYVYLDSKRVATGKDVLDPIITVPEVTTELSAPIEVKFDSTNVPIDKGKYQRISDAWDFGDESTSTGQIVSHIYEGKGTYTVKLTVTVKDKDSGELLVGGEYIKIISITNQALAAVFLADPQSGEAPLEVKFDASASFDPDGYLDRYEWDLDNDSEFDDAEGENIIHTFEKIGRYRVSLRVTSTTGEYDIEEKDIIVAEQENPEAVIKVEGEPETFEPGTSYVFRAEDSTSPNGKIEEYMWEFSDSGETLDTKTVSHIFEAPGTYEVTLTVTDEIKEIGTVALPIEVVSPQGTPQVVIKTTPAKEDNALSLSGKVPFTINFDARDSTDLDNNIVDYEWDFNDDGSADAFGAETSHNFNEVGIYTVRLTVIDADDNYGVATISVNVEEQGILADIEADRVEGNVPLTVGFDASGSTYQGGQITSYRWNFGDGTSPKLGGATITHKYTSIGTYTTTVTVIGSDNSQGDASVIITIREIPLSACFVSVFEEGEAPLETSFDPGCSTGTITDYLWDFGDGATSTTARPTHIFEEPGEYRVTLEVSDSENTVDTAELFITVTE